MTSLSSSGSYSSSSNGGAAGANAANAYAMFPMVEKTYRVRVTEDIERDLRFLGQSRVDALTSEFDMTLVKDKSNFKLYELEEKEFFTMKGVTTVTAPLGDVMNMLKMETTGKFRDVMGEIFGTLFLDGVMLHKGKETPARMHESLSVNWMALQASKPHLPHRDYVFLRYGDVFEKNAEHTSSVYGSNGSGLYVGASIWESIELDGCPPLPASQNVVRLRLRRCGIVVEEMNHEDGLKISLYISEAHPGRAAVSSLTKTWMTKMIACVAEIGNVMVAKSLSSQNILSKKQIVKDGACCFLCIKAFTLLRRKHHCRLCGDVVCSKCSEMKNLRQGGANKEIRVCEQCRNSSVASMRSSGSDSLSRGPRSIGNGSVPIGVKQPSISGYSSSDASSSAYEEDGYGANAVPGAQPVIHEHSIHSSVSESNSESMRFKTYPAAQTSSSTPPIAVPAAHLVHNRSRGPGDMIILNEHSSSSPHKGTSASDMIFLNSSKTINTRKGGAALHKERAESTNSTVSDASLNEFSMYAQPMMVPGVSEEEFAAMELANTITENTTFSYALNYSSRQEWPKPPVPHNEPERLKKVRELHLVDPGQHFQEMCEYAAAEMGCQIATICFVGDKSGFLMANVGVEQRELPRNVLFDAHTIMSTEPTIILDASEDIRFMNNPLVTDGKVRFYAGFPLVTSDGLVVGTFSVADKFARECVSGDKYFFLKNLADVAIRGVEQNTLDMQAPQHRMHTTNAMVEQAEMYVPPPPDMKLMDAHLTMQELLRTAYTTQHQVRMQVNPLGPHQ